MILFQKPEVESMGYIDLCCQQMQLNIYHSEMHVPTSRLSEVLFLEIYLNWTGKVPKI